MELIAFPIFSCLMFAAVLVAQDCDEINCQASNGTICNEQGTCDCGVCKCDSPYSGPTCEECPNCPSPCEIYRGCVGCKIFGTGPISTMECIIHCDYIATYFPVDILEFDIISDDDEQMLCRTLNKDYCMESFRIGGMTDGFRDLFVRTEMDCSAKYIPTEPPVLEVTVDIKNQDDTSSVTKSSGKERVKSEDVVAVAGSNQGQRYDGNSAPQIYLTTSLVAVLFIVVCIL